MEVVLVQLRNGVILFPQVYLAVFFVYMMQLSHAQKLGMLEN